MDESIPAKELPVIPEAIRKDISDTFARLGAVQERSGKHPTLRTRGSMMINHADGTYLHFSYTRAMSMDEAARVGIFEGDIAHGVHGVAKIWHRVVEVARDRWIGLINRRSRLRR